MGSLVSETGGEYVRARASAFIWKKVVWESGFDYAWKMFLRMAEKEERQEISWVRLLGSMTAQEKEKMTRLINVSAEEEKEMETRDVKKNPNLKKPELKKGNMRKIDVNPDEEFLLEFYRNKKAKEGDGIKLKEGENMQEYKSHETTPEMKNESHRTTRGLMRPPETSNRSSERKLKWTTPVRPLSEDITNWTSEDGKYLENVDMNDAIVKSSLDDLSNPISALGAVDQLACKELLNILELCKKQLTQQPFPYTVQSSDKVQYEYPLWATMLTDQSSGGQIANDVIESLMSEVMKYNEGRNFNVQGIWDVPKFLELDEGKDIPWAADIAVGISESHDNKRMVEGKVDWNGRPPPSTRKISVLICLTEASMYEGGEFELITSETKQLKLSIGDVVMWPSFLARRIKPVTKGKLVMFQIFNNGDYFK